MGAWSEWTEEQARAWLVVPGAEDDKYTRGVLGVVTGSDRYPGAAVIGVEAAVRTGLGMVRYFGAARPSALVLQRRPEVVTVAGRVQAWLIGSGMDASGLHADERALIEAALRSALPVVADAGALAAVTSGIGRAAASDREPIRGADAGAWRVVVTPHAGELAGMSTALGVPTNASEVKADPIGSSVRVAEALGVVVVLKGSTTHVAMPDGTGFLVSGGPAWLATAGSGDALAGILGALLATNAGRVRANGVALASVAASAVVLHALAGDAAAARGPLAALDVADAVRGVVARLLS